MASTQEQRIDRTISGAMDQIDRLQKVFRADGKLANAIAEVGGDTAIFGELQTAFDSLYDSLESAHYDALGHLGVDESIEEAKKPDYPDIDDDGDTEEDISKAAKDKKEKEEAKESLDYLKKLAGITESDDEDEDDEEEEE